jgi:hypothetical protein
MEYEIFNEMEEEIYKIDIALRQNQLKLIEGSFSEIVKAFDDIIEGNKIFQNNPSLFKEFNRFQKGESTKFNYRKSKCIEQIANESD